MSNFIIEARAVEVLSLWLHLNDAALLQLLLRYTANNCTPVFKDECNLICFTKKG
jgi:hypothetical protein